MVVFPQGFFKRGPHIRGSFKKARFECPPGAPQFVKNPRNCLSLGGKLGVAGNPGFQNPKSVKALWAISTPKPGRAKKTPQALRTFPKKGGNFRSFPEGIFMKNGLPVTPLRIFGKAGGKIAPKSPTKNLLWVTWKS